MIGISGSHQSESVGGVVSSAGVAGSKPIQRFSQKAQVAGFWNLTSVRQRTLADYALDTLLFLWPEAGYAFWQVVCNGGEVKEAAQELRVDDRTIHRYLAGYKEHLGAEDLYLVLLELYREADFVAGEHADTLYRSMRAALSGNPRTGPILKSYITALLEALLGGDLSELKAAVPKKTRDGEYSISSDRICWPSLGQTPPSTRSGLPGWIAVISTVQDGMELHRLCFIAGVLSVETEIHDNSWSRVLRILNTGGSKQVAKNGGLSAEHLGELQERSETLIRLVLRRISTCYGILAVLARTPVNWQVLCDRAQLSDLALLAPPDDVRICYERFLSSLGAEG